MLQQLLDRQPFVIQQSTGDGRQANNGRLRDILDQNRIAPTTVIVNPSVPTVGGYKPPISSKPKLKDSIGEDDYPDDFYSASGTSAKKSEFDLSHSKGSPNRK